jgi:ubiquinol-cytochrome c reductase cytochrome b subunit
LGSIIFVFVLIQIISGFFLSSHYVAEASTSFNSIEQIMRTLNFGWLLRYVHANAVTMLFVALYYHIGKAIYFGLFNDKKTTHM